MKHEVYILGEGTNYLETSKYDWPYCIEYDSGNTATPFILSEGVAHGAMGGAFSAVNLLSGDWDKHIQYTKSEWLFPFAKRIASGEPVSIDEVIEAYKSVYGTEPRTRK